MKINSYDKEGVKVVCIDGKFDGSTAEQVQTELETYIEPNCSLIIDMGKCSYVSSAGLRVLLMTAKALKKIGGKGVFASLSEEVGDVMEMTGFATIFDSYDTISEAIKKVLEDKDD